MIKKAAKKKPEYVLVTGEGLDFQVGKDMQAISKLLDAEGFDTLSGVYFPGHKNCNAAMSDSHGREARVFTVEDGKLNPVILDVGVQYQFTQDFEA